MHNAFRLIVAAALLIATQASAYLISPRLPVHESMTRMAFACAARATAEPSKCWTEPGKLTLVGGPYSPEEKAIRWPDDPLRQGDSKLTLLSLAKAIVRDCPKEIKAADGGDKTLYDAGVVCSSHYGRLQFMHAMASAGDDRFATMRKIYAWSAFTFDVASGRVSTDQDLCTAIGNNAAYAALADAFEAAPDGSCDLPESQQAMTVRSFFASDCAHVVHSCAIGDDALVRRAAVGALMHLVQDSYSQSHVARPIDGVAVPFRGPFTATVACTFPVVYFDYGAQAVYDNHSDGDQQPTLDTSCQSGPVVEPVTASAVIWWKVSHNRPTADMLNYLTAHVFGTL